MASRRSRLRYERRHCLPERVLSRQSKDLIAMVSLAIILYILYHLFGF